MHVKKCILKTVVSIFLALFGSLALAKMTQENAYLGKQIGIASFYHDKFQGRLTANGERFDQNKLTTTHATLPFGTVLRVTNLKNNRSVHVRVNDRANAHNKRLLDLSKRAARELAFTQSGLTKVKVEIVSLGET